MKKTYVIALVLLSLFIVAAVVHGADAAKQVSGKVTFVCPKQKAIKVECAGGKTWTLWVDEKADTASKIQEQIKGLKVNDQVTVSYVEKDGKQYITEIKKT